VTDRPSKHNDLAGVGVNIVGITDITVVDLLVVVVLGMHMTRHYAMLQRNLLYTGVTRGKRLVVLVGQKKASPSRYATSRVAGDGRSCRNGWVAAGPPRRARRGGLSQGGSRFSVGQRLGGG